MAAASSSPSLAPPSLLSLPPIMISSPTSSVSPSLTASPPLPPPTSSLPPSTSSESFSFFSPPSSPSSIAPLSSTPDLSLPSSPPPSYVSQVSQPTHFAPLSVVQSLTGASIFLTGGTGFVGKVIVEKLLRSCPSIARLYLLVRPRKGSTADERLEKEVVQSEIFTRLKKEIGEEAFRRLVKDKLRALGGEMTQNGIGLGKEDSETLTRDVDVIIHCAAIVDFNERLDKAIELNVLGSLRLLAIAQQCSRLSAFVHVSTCYVNSNRRGWMDEKLYPLGFDPDEMLRRVSVDEGDGAGEDHHHRPAGRLAQHVHLHQGHDRAPHGQAQGQCPARPSCAPPSSAAVRANPCPAGWMSSALPAPCISPSGWACIKFLPGSPRAQHGGRRAGGLRDERHAGLHSRHQGAPTATSSSTPPRPASGPCTGATRARSSSSTSSSTPHSDAWALPPSA